jgi:restriction system protein
MAVPTYDKFIEPILRYLASNPDGAAANDVHDAAAAMLNVSDVERQELLPSGNQPVYKNRAGWAHDRLKRAGLSVSPRRGYWQLTQQGLDFALAHPTRLSQRDVEKLALGFNDIRLLPQTGDEPLPTDDLAVTPTLDRTAAVASPDDRLGDALAELRRTVAGELQEALAAVSPAFFETVVLDVLHRLGYGASRTDLQRVGGVGDGGIDGSSRSTSLVLRRYTCRPKDGNKRWAGLRYRGFMEHWPGSAPQKACS